MRKSVLYPALALTLGGAAAGLRMWQRAAGYDESGLPVSMSPPAVVLTVFLLLCAGLFLLLALRLPRPSETDLPLDGGGVCAALLAAGGVLLLVGSVFHLKAVADAFLELSGAVYASERAESAARSAFLARNLMPAAMAVAAVPAAAALLSRAKRAREGVQGELSAFAALAPSFFCWLWLIEVYRRHTANPILWDYILLLLAAVALLLSGYGRAGFAFGAGKGGRSVFLSLLALFFVPAALPDSGGLGDALTLLALAMEALAELYTLIAELDPPYRPRRLAADEESEPKENIQNEQE